MVTLNLKQAEQMWLAGLRTGDAEVCQAFVQEVRGIVGACCVQMGLSVQASEDVAGETFVSVLRGLQNFQGQAGLGSWVWTIAYRQSVNYVRRLARDNRHHQTQRWLAEDEFAVRHPLETAEQDECLRAAVNQLPQNWARALELYYWQSKSTREIADVMQVRDGVVRSYLFRGRNRLRTLLQAKRF